MVIGTGLEPKTTFFVNEHSTKNDSAKNFYISLPTFYLINFKVFLKESVRNFQKLK